MPKLSIIVPVYNKSPYIDDTIESILSQTFNDFELILVNDGSTDDSGLKCESYGKKDRRITVIHQVNQGVSSARNVGLARATGDYIGFVDSDDTLEPDMYQTLLTVLDGLDADIAICGVRRIDGQKSELFFGSKQVKTFNREQGIQALLTGRIMMSIYDKVYKRNILEEAIFYGSIYEDLQFNFTVFSLANKLIFYDFVKYNYIIRDNSISVSQFNQKYMNCIAVTGGILKTVSASMPEHLNQATILDFTTNIFILNLVLLSSKQKFAREYDILVENLSIHNRDKDIFRQLKPKHRYGYGFFRIAPSFYTQLIRLHSVWSNTDLSRRRAK